MGVAGLLLPALPVSSLPGAFEEVPSHHWSTNGRVSLHGQQPSVTPAYMALVQMQCHCVVTTGQL